MPDLTPEQLAAIEARAAKATPGPWGADATYPGGVYCDDATGSLVARVSGDGFEYVPRAESEWQANAAFIAAAREDIPALAAALRRAWEEIARLQAVPPNIEVAYDRDDRRWLLVDGRWEERDLD